MRLNILFALLASFGCDKAVEIAKEKQQESRANAQKLMGEVEEISKYTDCVVAAETPEADKACEDMKAKMSEGARKRLTNPK